MSVFEHRIKKLKNGNVESAVVAKKRKKRRQPLPKKELDRYKCNDCKVNVLQAGEFYMLHPDLWEKKLGLGWDDNLCIGCLEQRLGRKVVGPFSDFCALPNYPWMYPASDRMADRFGFVRDDKGKWRHKSEAKKKRRKA